MIASAISQEELLCWILDPQNKRKELFSFEHHRVPFGGKPPVKFLSQARVPDKIKVKER
jgi:hypothetical protein